MKLIIGNKNLSSWSLRPWLVLRHFGVAFDEVLVQLDVPGSRGAIRKHSPSGLVPCLTDGDLVVNDSLAIIEHAAELCPDDRIWPRHLEERARARSVSAEMHAGFLALRGTWPMDMVNEARALTCPPGVAKDLARINVIWTEALERSGGPFLFGAFTAADAMYAPVVSRLRTYGPVRSFEPLTDYMNAVWELPAMKEWREGAKEEKARGWYA